jgi:hypothetical protein
MVKIIEIGQCGSYPTHNSSHCSSFMKTFLLPRKVDTQVGHCGTIKMELLTNLMEDADLPNSLSLNYGVF